jgi:hypothetical protein
VDEVSSRCPREEATFLPPVTVWYIGERVVSVDVSVGGGGRVEAVWRLRAPMQSRRLRIITAGCSGRFPSAHLHVCCTNIPRIFFLKERINTVQVLFI